MNRADPMLSAMNAISICGETEFDPKLIEVAAKFNVSADDIPQSYKTPEFDAVILCDRQEDLEFAEELRTLIKRKITLSNKEVPKILLNEVIATTSLQNSTPLKWMYEALSRSTFVFLLITDNFVHYKERLGYMHYIYTKSIEGTGDMEDNQDNIIPFYAPGFDPEKHTDTLDSIPELSILNISGISLKRVNGKLEFARESSARDLNNELNNRLHLKSVRMRKRVEQLSEKLQKSQVSLLRRKIAEAQKLASSLELEEKREFDRGIEGLCSIMNRQYGQEVADGSDQMDMIVGEPQQVGKGGTNSVPPLGHGQPPTDMSTNNTNNNTLVSSIDSPRLQNGSVALVHPGAVSQGFLSASSLSISNCPVVNVNVSYVSQFVATSGNSEVHQHQQAPIRNG